MTAAAKAFLSAFSGITGTGHFHAAGSEPFFLPELHINGLGEMAFPLAASQAKEIIALAEAAPFGKGNLTVFDESVRKCWQIDASRFSFKSPQWRKFLRHTLDAIQETLGIRGKISASPYKFLLYGPGGHFKAHKDTEKLDSMFGTLVISLPSKHEGGRLFIRHDGKEYTVDFSDPANARAIQFAAFFADCEHEVEPVRSGYRCCVVYNLRLDEGDPNLLNLSLTKQARTLLPSLAKLKTELSGDLGAVLLEHSYTEANLSLTKLKGNDQARAQALLAAAAESGLTAHLALVTLHQSGALEDYDHGRYHRRRYHDDDDDDVATDGTMGEIYEESLSITDWRDARNRKRDHGDYCIEEDQLITLEALTGSDPDQREAEGYTGNAGCTMDYWYRRAAIVLWPDEDDEAILCRYNLCGACATLETLASAKSTGPGTPFHRLASAMVDRYPDALPQLGAYTYRTDLRQYPLCVLLGALAKTISRDLIDRLMGNLPEEALQIIHADLWGKLQNAFGSDAFEDVYQKLQTAEATMHRRALFQVLASLATRSDSAARAQLIAAKLAKLEPAKPSPYAGWEISDPRPVGNIEEARVFLASSHHLGAETVRKAVRGFLQADSSVSYVRGVLGPALLEKSIVGALKRDQSLAPELLVLAISILESEIARPLPPYPNWTRPCPIPESPGPNTYPYYRRPASKRPDPIRELAEFMKNPNEQIHHFARPQDERSQIESFIRQHHLDLDSTTLRKGSPHTLACTKNNNSHQTALALREKDRGLLAKLVKLRH